MPSTPPEPRPYNGVEIQRAAILARLQQGPATCAQLQADCQAPDPRARVRDLRKAGHQIDTQAADQLNPDGTRNGVGLYVLLVKDDRQSELDLAE